MTAGGPKPAMNASRPSTTSTISRSRFEPVLTLLGLDFNRVIIDQAQFKLF